MLTRRALQSVRRIWSICVTEIQTTSPVSTKKFPCLVPAANDCIFFHPTQRSIPLRKYSAAPASAGKVHNTVPDGKSSENVDTSPPQSAASSDKQESKPDLAEELKKLTEENARLRDTQKETQTDEASSSSTASMSERMRQPRFADRVRSFLPWRDENSETPGSSYKEKYLRALAESENIRTRLTKQIDDAKQFGIQSFVKDLLEVSDILTKAMGSVPEEALSNKENAHLINLYEGLRLTEAQLTKVFKKHGLERIEAMGAKFDPNIHEALFEAPKQEGQQPGTVMAVTQTGYRLHNRTIRPSRVGVVKSG